MTSSNSLIQIPLQEETPETPETHEGHIPYVLRFSEILSLLRNTSRSLYTDTNKDYAEDIYQDLEGFIRFIRDPSKIQEIKRFFESFDAIKNISGKKLVNFIRLLQSMEDSEYVEGGITLCTYADVEALRSIFLAFGVLKTENVSGVLQKGKNPLLNLYANKKEGIPLRPFYIDGGNMAGFFPDNNTSNTQIFTSLKSELLDNKTVDIPSIVPDVQSQVQEIVAEVISSRPIEAGALEVEQSEFQKGAQRRRARDRERNASLRETRNLESEMEIFRKEYERYQNLHTFLSGQIDRLREFLILELPYTQEILNYIRLTHEEKEKKEELGYYEGLLIDDEKRTEVEIEASIAEFEKSLHELEKEKRGRRSSNGRNDESIIETDTRNGGSGITRIRGINSQIRELRILIGKERRKLSRKRKSLDKRDDWEDRVLSLENEIQDITKKISGGRIPQIPNTDEFIDGFYTVLGASEYSDKRNIPSAYMISEEWIEENIISILRGLFEKIRDILEKNHSIAGITLLDIFDALDTIESIDTEKGDGTLPEIPKGISMKKAQAFMDDFLKIIPQVSLIAYPNYGRIKKAIKIRKTRSEKRTEEKIKSKTRHDTKEVLRKELGAIESKFELYKQYWEKRHGEAKRSLLRTNNAIDAASMSNKGHDLLIKQKLRQEQELAGIEVRIKDDTLIDDSEIFSQLMKDRASIQRKIQRIRN